MGLHRSLCFVTKTCQRILWEEAMKLVAGNSNRPLAEAIAKYLNIPLTKSDIRRFADEEVFYGPTSEFCDNKISIIPDFISNCGMARAFDFLMSGKKEITDDSVFKDCSRIIKKALKDCYNVSSKKTRINSIALEIALKKLLK